MDDAEMILAGAKKLYGEDVVVMPAPSDGDRWLAQWLVQRTEDDVVLAYAWIDKNDGLPVYKPVDPNAN